MSIVGKTITGIEGLEKGSELIHFYTEGYVYRMHHKQSCCEDVQLEDFEGEAEDLIGHPVLSFEEMSESDFEEMSESNNNTCTWTFYMISTVKGTLWLRWLGTSNGNYSEEVSFDEISEEERPIARFQVNSEIVNRIYQDMKISFQYYEEDYNIVCKGLQDNDSEFREAENMILRSVNQIKFSSPELKSQFFARIFAIYGDLS
jgi:hypothetical protein